MGESKSCLLNGAGSRLEAGTLDLSASRQALANRHATWASDLVLICSFGGFAARPFRWGGKAG